MSTKATRKCSHGTPKSVRCEQCVSEGVYTYAQPHKALTVALDDRKQPFAGVATIRAAIFDVMDRFNPLIMDRDLIPDKVKSEDREDFERSTFVDAVIARIAELQQAPHDGVKLENLCPRHKIDALPEPTVGVCPECQKEFPKGETK